MVDLPIITLSFLVSFHESIVLTEVVSDTGLPTSCARLEFVPRILSFDVIVDLLKVHLASAG